MKKIIFSSMATALLASGVLMYSCQKAKSPASITPTTIKTDPLNISAKDNRLVFKTVEDYEKAVDNPTEEVMNNVQQQINRLSFSSLRKSQNNLKDSIKNDYFASMLNEDLAVQIGENIYRVNPKTEKVYVLPVSKVNEYAGLVAEDEANKDIAVYSTGEEVISLVNSGQASQVDASRCKETGIGGHDKITDIYPVTTDNTLRFEGQLHYNRYGIHFSLWAEGKIHPSNSNQPYTGLADVHITLYPVYYHVRCGTTVGPYYPDGGKENGYRRYSSYQGSKNLNKVYFRAKFEIVKFSSDSVKQETGYIEIRQNY